MLNIGGLLITRIVNRDVKKIQLFIFIVSIIPFIGFTQSKDCLIDPLAEIKLIADSFRFTEGPVCDKAGNLYFSDIRASRIYVWGIDKRLSIFKEPSGRANGLRFDRNGNLLICEGAGRRLVSRSSNGKETVLADHYQGKKLNSPNDLWIDPKGGIYFTDPRYGNAKWIWIEKGGSFDQVADSLFKEGQEVRALYYLPPDGLSLQRVSEGFVNPNGVVGTTDGKKLYVSDTEKREIYVFDILSDGSLSNRKIFISEYSDGMTIDEFNNLYTTNGGIQIYAPDGKLITTIDLPCKASNVSFGGKNNLTLYITARQCLFKIQMKVSGQ